MNKRSKEYIVPKVKTDAERLLPIITNQPECPQCKSNENVRKVLWGLIREFNKENLNYYKLGGCKMLDETHKCIQCNFRFKV